MDLKTRIEQIVKESLPETQAFAFKEYIEEAELTKSKLCTSERMVTNLKETLKTKERELTELRELKLIKGELDKREKDLNTTELSLNNTILKEKLTSANQVVANNMSLLGVLFNNKDISKMVSGSVGIDIPTNDQYGNSVMHHATGHMNGRIDETE